MAYAQYADKERRREYLRNYRANNKARAQETHRLREYGLTQEQYDVLLEAQNFKCAVCGEPSPTCVDHCHTTNRVRGLLCTHCNVGLGHFADDITRLSNAIEYLTK